ncbi:MAG: hypothetical protein AAGI38_24890, partial [Bacteroidota bacterium]
EDIILIMLQAFDRLEDPLFNHHLDILEHYDTDDTYAYEVGSHMLGRMTGAISKASPELHERLLAIIRGHIDKGDKSPLVKNLLRMSTWPELSTEQAQSLIQAFETGFQEA